MNIDLDRIFVTIVERFNIERVLNFNFHKDILILSSNKKFNSVIIYLVALGGTGWLPYT